MELKQIWAVIRRRWWLIVLPVVVAGILVVPSLRSVLASAAGYSVTIQFTASQTPTGDSSAKTFEDQSYIPWLASEYAVNNLASWISSESFAREVAAKLQAQGKTINTDALHSVIKADSARSIMRLYVTSWPDADEIKLIAQAAVEVLQEKNQAYFPQFAAQKAQIIPQDSIIVAPIATPLSNRLSPLLRLAVGLVAGLGLAFLADYLDPSIRSRAEVEALELPVLAEIPGR
jgi:capsular polysaccharide biosynthesis protein